MSVSTTSRHRSKTTNQLNACEKDRATDGTEDGLKSDETE